MRFPYLYFGLAAVVAAMAASACGSDPGEPPPPPIEQPPPNAVISFDHEGTLTLAPGETTVVQVSALPAARYEVSFFLVGDALDASLSQSTVVSDPYGHAAVALRAPNGATYFAIRASLKDGPSAELPVAVSDQGFGALDILPINPGPREAELWVANVATGTTCEALAAVLPEGPDEAPPPVSAPPGEPLVIEDVPVGPNLAVYVRGGFYLWGCTDEPNLVAGDTLQVEVQLVNKPVDLTDALLDVEFGFVPDEEEWGALLDDSKQLMHDGLLSGHPSEAAALLAAMSAASADPQQFDQASSSGGWLTLTEGHLAAAASTISETMQSMVDEGMTGQPEGAVGQLETVDADNGYALFTLERLGSISPADGGVPAEYLMTLTADPDDTVRLGGGIFWIPSQHLAAAAAQYAADQYPGLNGMGEILGQIFDCPTLATTLGSYPACDASCLEQLCTAGLDGMWTAALEASVQAGLVGSVTFQASGAAQFDDHAALTGFEGDWLGKVTNGLLDATVQGVVSAEEAQHSPAQ